MCDLANYPALASAVRKIDVEEDEDGSTISDWEVTFRRGVMKWRERDIIDRTKRTIRFFQLEGDLHAFAGSWRVATQGEDVEVIFDAQFDLGIPSLASMLDPIAEQALRDNVAELISAFCEVRP